MKQISLCLCLLAVLSTPVMAQTCKPESITPSHPAGQYLDNGDGTVTDIVNGLMWSRCSLGQNYQSGHCTNDPINFLTWKEALQAGAANSSYATHDGWRLPNIKELESLVERSCVAPAIDLALFPSTPSTVYWSNTFDRTAVNATAGIKGLIIDFRDGSEFVTDVNRYRFVRMVRDLSSQ